MLNFGRRIHDAIFDAWQYSDGEYKDNTFNCKISDDFTIKITELLNKNDKKIVIPQVIDGMKVTGIASECFWSSNIKSITIPKTINKIGKRAFYCCEELTNVTFENSIKAIEIETFYNCKKLKNIIIPNTVIKINKRAFMQCTSLTSVSIPDSVEIIGDSAFDYCKKLKEVKMGNSVKKIGKQTFCNTKLTTVKLSSALIEIGKEAFFDCNNISKFSISSKNKYFSTKSGVLYSNNGKNLLLYPPKKKTKSFTVSDNVTSIEENAFRNNKYLKSITFGKGIKENKRFMLYRLKKLKKVKFKASIKKAKSPSFFRCVKLKEVIIKNGSEICLSGLVLDMVAESYTLFKTNNAKVLPIKTTTPIRLLSAGSKLNLTAKSCGKAIITVTEGSYLENEWFNQKSRKIQVKVY